MRDRASIVRRSADLLAEGLLTPTEFAAGMIETLVHDPNCDAIGLLCELPAIAQEAVLDEIRKYAAKDYIVTFFYLGSGDTNEAAVARQPQLRKLCEQIKGSMRC